MHPIVLGQGCLRRCILDAMQIHDILGQEHLGELVGVDAYVSVVSDRDLLARLEEGINHLSMVGSPSRA